MLAASLLLWHLAQSGLTSSDPVDLAFRAVTALGFGGAAIYYVRRFQKDYIDTGSQRQLEMIAEIARKDAENAALRAENERLHKECDRLNERIDELVDERRHDRRVIDALRDSIAADDLLTDLMDPDIPDPPEDPES